MAFIGKNVIENLTTAMYEDLRIIYREYIQNAADSIDKAIAQKLITPEEARIDIEIDSKQRTITVVDNGVGISCSNFNTFSGFITSLFQTSSSKLIETKFCRFCFTFNNDLVTI